MPARPRLPSPRARVLAAAALGMAAAYGALGTIGILIGPFEAEFGWPRAEVSLAYTLLALGAAAGGLAMGRLADRMAPGPIAAAGVAVIALGLALIAQQSSLRAIQGLYLALGLLGFSALTAPLLATVSRWFDARAGMALGLATAGGALGQALIPPLFQALIAALGWRLACLALAALYAALVLPAVATLRNPDHWRTEATPAPSAAWPVPPAISLALLGAAAFFCCVLMAAPLVHLVPLATGAGLPPATAAALATTAMAAGALGRIATGWIADRAGPLAAYALASALQTATVYGFVADAPLWATFAVAAAFGLGFGGVMTALVCAVRAAVPARSTGSAMALVSLLAWAGMGSGGYQAGLCFDRTGSYDPAFLAAALAGLANLAALALLALLIRRANRPLPLHPHPA